MQTAANDEKNSIANSADAIERWIKGPKLARCETLIVGMNRGARFMNKWLSNCGQKREERQREREKGIEREKDAEDVEE